MKKLWPFSLYFLYFAFVAFVMPFAVLYYQSRGFDGAEIGFITGITPLIGLVSAPLLIGFADATRRHRLVMSIALLGAAIGFFLVPMFAAFAPLVLLAILTNALLSPFSALSDSATMFMLADEMDMYGRIRLGGTIGFAIAATLAGFLVQQYGLDAAFWGGAILLSLGCLVSQKLTYAHAEGKGLSREGVRELLANRRWPPFLILAFAGGFALAATNNFLLPHMKALGAHESLMGIALTAGTFGEIPVLFFGNRLIRRFKSFGLFVLAMLITAIRLLALGAVNKPELILIFQLFNGLTFPMMWMAGVAYANENSPRGMNATSQGLFGMLVYGFGSSAGNFIAGPMLTSLGGHWLFISFGIAVLITIAVVMLLENRMRIEPKAESVS